MKRLERVGTIAFLTITISFVFHLIAMSFNHWIENTCVDCDVNSPLVSWHTAIKNRCYDASMASLILQENSSDINSYVDDSFIAEICIPNEILMAKKMKYSLDCLLESLNQTHTVCSTNNYNKSICYCDYTSRTKVVLSMTILTAFSLGCMLFLGHLISFTKLDYLLRWLFPLCFILLTISILCIIVTLASFSSTKTQDVNELIYSSSLIESSLQNGTLPYDLNQYFDGIRKINYQVKISWCLGLEILALQFSLVTLILYLLMFFAKTRPEEED